MRRSITAFICGRIGSLFSLFWGFVAGVAGNVGSIIGNATDSGLTTINVVYVLGWVAFVGGIIGIVGSAFCFKKARKGGVLLTISTVFCGALQGYLFYLYVSQSKVMITTSIIIFLLPIVLLIVSAVAAFCAKEKNYGNVNTVSESNESVAKSTSNSLEAELINLKGMFEKGLITQDEYDAAKKSAIDKYMK